MLNKATDEGNILAETEDVGVKEQEQHLVVSGTDKNVCSWAGLMHHSPVWRFQSETCTLLALNFRSFSPFLLRGHAENGEVTYTLQLLPFPFTWISVQNKSPNFPCMWSCLPLRTNEVLEELRKQFPTARAPKAGQPWAGELTYSAGQTSRSTASKCHTGTFRSSPWGEIAIHHSRPEQGI